jgi:hypothetical protein
MSNQIRAKLYLLNNPRKIVLLFNLILLALALAGCGDVIPACPSGGGTTGCGGG